MEIYSTNMFKKYVQEYIAKNIFSNIWACHFCTRKSILFVEEHRANFCWENHIAGRGSWSWQRIMMLADDHDPCRRSCSWQTSMLLLEQYDIGWEQGTTIRAPPRNHLGTIFGRVPKLISKCFWTGLRSKFVRQNPAYSVKEGQKRHIHIPWMFLQSGGVERSRAHVEVSFM